VTVAPASPEAIARAAEILRRGGLVAFPTETVYGLGADATLGDSVAKIYAAKGRPSRNPLIVHVGEREWVAGLAIPDGRFDKLARTFWPGPLTLVLNRRPDCPVSPLVTAGGATIAVRMPDHPVARDLLKAVRRPLAAPSANLSGRVSPTRATDIDDQLASQIGMIIDGGPCRVGLESTVLDLTSHPPTLLRPGAIGIDAIEAAIGPVETGHESPDVLRSPGQLASHYAPLLPLRLNATDRRPGEALLGFGPVNGELNLSKEGELAVAASNLFAMLRALDQPAVYRTIAIAPIPNRDIGIAINDRLRRAAAPRPITG